MTDDPPVFRMKKSGLGGADRRLIAASPLPATSEASGSQGFNVSRSCAVFAILTRFTNSVR
jgi:hypothetical protein